MQLFVSYTLLIHITQIIFFAITSLRDSLAKGQIVQIINPLANGPTDSE